MSCLINGWLAFLLSVADIDLNNDIVEKRNDLGVSPHYLIFSYFKYISGTGVISKTNVHTRL